MTETPSMETSFLIQPTTALLGSTKNLGSRVFSSSLCVYPYVAVPDCSQTYSELIPVRYVGWQVVYTIVGICTTLASIFQLIRVYKRGSSLQKGVYPLLLIASLTFILRAVDPNSYGNKLPLIVAGLAKAICSAALYTVTFAINIIWARLLRGYSDKVRFTGMWGQLYMAALIVISWVAVLAPPAVISSRPEEEAPAPGAYIAIFSALVFAIITGIIYLIHVGRHLNARVKETANFSADVAAKNKIGVVKLLCPRLQRQTRVMKILIVFTIVTFLISLAQIYAIVVHAKKTKTAEPENFWRRYSECLARSTVQGADCKPRFEDEVFPVLQIIVLGVLFWVFWKIRDGGDNDGDSVKLGRLSLPLASSTTNSLSGSLQSPTTSTSKVSHSSLSSPENSRSSTDFSASSYNSGRANQNWDEYMTMEDPDCPSLPVASHVNRASVENKTLQKSDDSKGFRAIKVLP